MRITAALLGLNILVFGWLSTLAPGSQQAAFSTFAYSTEALTGGQPWTLITSMFLHGSAAHLGLNMIALFFFGGALEDELSPAAYLGIYFGGGIAGSLFSSLVFSASQMSIGASGAIFALMGAGMLLAPFEFVAYPWLVPIPIVLVGIVMIISNLLLFLAPPPGTNISFAAHLGGGFVGLLYGFHRQGLGRGVTILIVGFLLFLLLTNVMPALNLLNYTQNLPGLSGGF